MRWQRFLAGGLMVLLTTLPAHSDLREGIAAYRAGDYATAYRELLPVARAGDAEAQSLVAGMIAEGLGTGAAPNPTMAADWYALAADQRHLHATTMLGWYHMRGLGVPQDPVKGYRLLSRAAARGEPQAIEMTKKVAQQTLTGLDELVNAEARKQSIDLATAYYRVGQSFAKGYEVPRLLQVAAEAFHRAAKLGHSAAQFEFGLRLDRGEGLAEDPVRAFEWFSKAQAQGHADAGAMVGRALLLGRGTTANRYRALVAVTQAKAAGSDLAQQVLDQLGK